MLNSKQYPIHANNIEMKQVLYISSLAFLFFIAPSCNKKLDVQPQNNITPDQIKTSSDVEAVLYGAYNQLQSYSAWGEQFTLIPDLLASDDQVDWVGTYAEYKQVKTKKIVATNSIASSIWGNSYKVIFIANTVLDKLSLVDSADKASVEGQALCLRGAMYFQLVGLFAKPYSDGGAATNLGVPIVLDPSYFYDSTKDKPARATVAAVYAQVIKDLQAAITKLPASNGVLINQYTAEAFLSRVYLNMGDYANAVAMADDVIQHGGFSLNSTYDKEFNNAANTSEDIFAIQQTSQSNAGTSNQGLTTFWCPYGGLPPGQTSGRGDAQINSGYFNYFEPQDFRGTYTTDGTSIAGASGTYPNKWQFFYKAIPVIRLAEMYLTRGEANLAAGTTVGADPVDDINTVRARAGASLLSSVASSDFVDERFREMGFEGDRFWTLKRLKQDVDGYTYDDNKIVLPIPQSEVDVNKAIVQNGGY